MGRGDSSRAGLIGKEDLGDGWTATFNFETRFLTDTGALEKSSVFWQGESTLGLSNTRLGSFVFGRGPTRCSGKTAGAMNPGRIPE